MAARREGDFMINRILAWLADGAHWQGDDGILRRVVEHLEYSLVAVLIAALIAIPLGLYIGHTGRGRFLVVNAVGAARAIPSLGLLYLAFFWLAPRLSGESAFLAPAGLVLVVLAIPPILSGAYAGVEGVEPAARDAAVGMGMRGQEVMRHVELPCALPLILSGIRSAMLQVIATATIAAVLGLGGLGRFPDRRARDPGLPADRFGRHAGRHAGLAHGYGSGRGPASRGVPGSDRKIWQSQLD